MALQRLARAKINLFLHVGPVVADGYHPLCSLVTFADVGDMVRIETAAQSSFSVVGPFAGELGSSPDNLVLRACDLMLARRPATPPLAITLDKRLPIASGVGGGSSDAATALVLLGELFDWDWVDREGGELARLAAPLGSDVPMCLSAAPAVAEGRGEVLGPSPPFPDLDVVLVNPRQPSPTGPVYRGYDAGGPPGAAAPPEWPKRLDTAGAMAAFLARCRNDLEAPAISLQPAIAGVLATLRQRPQTLFARMSGSGATCFALCANAAAAQSLAASITVDHPGWWVEATRLAGAPQPQDQGRS